MEEQPRRRKYKKRKKKHRLGREAVVSFRLAAPSAIELEVLTQSSNIRGIYSKGRMARKLVMDYLMGRLTYINPQDRFVNPDLQLNPRVLDESERRSESAP